MTMLRNRWVLLALALYLAVFVASLVLRPYWRDEYWALYFSGMGKTLPETVEAITHDVHPPLYFVMLHFWRMLSEHELWVRVFNVVVIALGGLAAWSLRGSRKEETLTFLFLCATSYWLIFYGVEARMMGMEFVLCALSVLIIRNTMDHPERWATGALLFFAVGVVASTSHFFGALWFAVAGACVGFALLKKGRFGAFVGWGVASVAAIAPVTLWIIAATPTNNAGASEELRPIGEAFVSGIQQFSRGLVVKTMFGNIAATCAALLCVGALARRRDAFSLVIAAAALGTVVFAFVIHLFFVNLIKERAFIVMMPALIYLIAEAIHSVQPTQKRAQWLINAIPIVAIVSLPLFATEYFKDRERVSVVRETIAQYAEACDGQPIVFYFRPNEQGADFGSFYTNSVLAGAGGERDIVLVDAAELQNAGAAPASTCPVRAVALALPRGEDERHVEARRMLRGAGVDLDSLEERSIANGRSLIFLTPGS